MSVPVIFHNLAIADVEEAFCWYQEKQPDLGDSFIAELENKEEQISANPELYPRIYRNAPRNTSQISL